MNFDPRTEAEIERQAEIAKAIVRHMAKTCAQMQVAYNETEAEAFAVAFETAWNMGTRYISAVEFYREVSRASAEL
jgi:hypothetical protein